MAAAEIERPLRRQADHLHALQHAPPDFAEQEFQLPESRAAPVEGKPGQPRGRQEGIGRISSMQGHGQTRREDDGKAAATRAGRQVYAPIAKAAGPFVALAALARALLPCRCALCATVQDEVVCEICARELLRPVSRCPACALHPPSFDQAFTLGDYAAPQDALVLALKFGNALPLAGWLASALASRLGNTWSRPPDLLAPIPLSSQRLAERGFNQAWEIARPLGRRLGVPGDPVLLERRHDTAAQHTLDLAARLVNLHGAFRLARPGSLAGRHVALVDDVMTSGATLDEAARVLKAHGAERVSVIVALRTP